MSSDDHGPGGIDWLDLGPDPDEGRKPADPRRRYLWYGVAAALVVLALVLTRTQHGTNPAAPSAGSPFVTGTPSHTISSGSATSGSASSSSGSSGPASSPSFVDPPVTSVTAPSDGQPTGPATAPRLGPPKVTNLRHPLLDVPADWELFGWGPGVVVRIQLALGRITTTAVPVLKSSIPAVLFVGSDRVLVRSLDDTTGYLVRDGKPAAELPRFLKQGFLMLPGPDQQHLWTNALSGAPNVLALMTPDGSLTGVSIFVPANASVEGADGAGYVLLTGLGGVYDAQPGGVHRITTGTVLASGPTRWLAFECDDSLSCARVVIDRATRARHRLGSSADSTGQNSGTISPDGKTAALLLPSDGISPNGIQLVDLDSGADRAVAVVPNSTGNQLERDPSWAWSPDSRWLFVTDDVGRVIIINRATGRATPLEARLPSVDHLAVRHGTG